MDLPSTPPFAIRARLLTPLDAGSTLHERDGLVAVDAAGRIEFAGAAEHVDERRRAGAIDLRPWVLMPGMVDLHAHLPQLPNAGVGFAVDLLTWLDRLTFPTERSWSDVAVAERLAPGIFEAFAAAGTTTVLAYGTVYAAAMDAAFRAAEAHGIRAILGKVMMDRGTYDPIIEPSTILERSLQESADLIGRWHGAADRPAAATRSRRGSRSPARPTCCASRPRSPGAPAPGGRRTCRRIRSRSTRSRRLFPDALDYVDVYDRAGGLGERTVLAHAVHLSEREQARLVETGTRIAHCPASNLFLGAGVMPLSARLEAGPDGRARVGRVGRSGCLDLLGHAGRRVRPDGAAIAGR